MTQLERALVRLAADLGALGARWALLGGLALAVHAEPRTTRDLDVAVATASDAEAERLVRLLGVRGYRLLEQLENNVSGRLATVRVLAPGEKPGGIVIDLFFDHSGLENDLVQRAATLALVPGLEAPIVLRGDLLALKVLAARPRDLEDAGALIAAASGADLDQARSTLRDLGGLGIHRRGDFEAELEQLIARQATGPFRG
jgi:hypothetical protein